MDHHTCPIGSSLLVQTSELNDDIRPAVAGGIAQGNITTANFVRRAKFDVNIAVVIYGDVPGTARAIGDNEGLKTSGEKKASVVFVGDR